MNEPKDLIKAEEARRLLGVSPQKMARLLSDKALHVYTDLLDKRVKLVSRAEVEALKRKRPEAA